MEQKQAQQQQVILTERFGMGAGKEPAALVITSGAHTFKFGRRTAEGPVYFEVVLDDA